MEKEGQIKIPVVFACDNNYKIPLGVAMSSLLSNALKDTFYELYLLYTGGLSNDLKGMLLKLQKMYSNFTLEMVKVENELLKDATSHLPYISNATFYRLFISELLPKYDKIIYLDCDILVLGDLKELFEYNIQNYFLAGVIDWECQEELRLNKKRQKEIGIDLDIYVNAGILLMNLKLIREKQMVEIFKQQMKIKYSLADQDILNICFHNKILRLPFKYNLKARYYRTPKLLEKSSLFLKDRVEESCNNPLIVHFVGNKVKPWYNFRCKCGELWRKEAKKFISAEEYQKMEEIAKLWQEYISWYSTLNWARQQNRIVVFGFTDIGRDLTESLQKAGVNNIVCFCDNSKQKQGEIYNGVEVLDIQDALAQYGEVSIINTSQNYYNEIEVQLLKEGIDKSKIRRFFSKGYIYYISITQDFYEDEIKEIYYKEFGEDETDIDKISKKLIDDEELLEKYKLRDWCWISRKETRDEKLSIE